MSEFSPAIGIKERFSQKIVVVSHLVKLLDVKKAPTWNISILPTFFKKFHTMHSQMVSKFFGGQRKVVDTDIKVLYLPARLRTSYKNG